MRSLPSRNIVKDAEERDVQSYDFFAGFLLKKEEEVPEEERIERAKWALKIVGLEKREDHMPNQMSGGQQQRVAIARGIVNDAPIILADEPTGNLDTKTSIEVMEFFVNLNEKHGKTIVLVTHEPDIAEYCKRVVKFKDGNIESDITKRL